MMTHDNAQDLLAVLALNAVEGDERLELEEHVAECIRCSQELDGLRGVSSSLGNISEPASAELWQRISQHLYDDMDPGSLMALRTPRMDGGAVAPLRWRPRTASNMVGARVFALAAVVLVGILSFNLVQANKHASQLTSALGVANRGTVATAEAAPGHTNVTLSSVRHVPVAKIVLLNGHGYVVSSRLGQLPPDKVYQLWGIIEGKPISIGLMGQKPTNVEFSVSSAPKPSEIAITIEPAKGSQLPSSPIIASGTVTA